MGIKLGDRVRYTEGIGEGVVTRSCRPHYEFLMNHTGCTVWLVQFSVSAQWMPADDLAVIRPTEQLTLF